MPVQQWVVAWGNSTENALPTQENSGGSEQSFRSLFLPTVAGTQERIHLSNRFGTTPLTVGSARLAIATGVGSAIDPTHDVALTFAGSPSVTIAPGQEVVSDSANITYSFGQKMAVSLYLKGTYPPLSQHESQVTVNYATPDGGGDQTADSAGEAYGISVNEWFLLSGMDVYGSYAGTVVLLGSSSIDGHGSNTGDTNAYPVANVAVVGQDNDRPSDWLARQLHDAGMTNVGVLNAGEIADPAAPDKTTATGLSTAGIDRIDHDVLQQPGVKAVVIYLGGIDLRSDCLPATAVEQSLTTLVSKSQAAGVRVILGTIPPSAYCQTAPPLPGADPYAGDLNDGPENPGSMNRRAVNDWIRTQGAGLPGVVAIADFDKALADPQHPDFLMPHLNSGDNFHPNGTGYGVQSSAIPLDKLLGP